MKIHAFAAIFAVGLFISNLSATDLVETPEGALALEIQQKVQDIRALKSEFKELSYQCFGWQTEYTSISNEYAALCQTGIVDDNTSSKVRALQERTKSIYQELNLVYKNIKDVRDEHMVVAGILNSLWEEYYQLTGRVFELDQGKDNQNTKKASLEEQITKLPPANQPQTKGAFSVISSGFRTALPKAMTDEGALNLEKGKKLSRWASQNCLMPVNVVCNSSDEFFRVTLVRSNHSPNKKTGK